MKPCPCCSAKPYKTCCQPYLRGKAIPPTALALMRSRYTAYTKANVPYLLKMWDPSETSKLDAEELKNWASKAVWMGLEIIATEAGTQTDDTGTVEFVARYQLDNSAHQIHEKSVFHKVDGKWIYLHGID